MPEALLVFRTNKKFRTFQHLLNHHTCGIFDLHHSVELKGQVFWGTDIKCHAAHIAFVNGTYNLSYNRITHTIGKGCQFFFRGADQLGHKWDTCTFQDVTHGLWLDITVGI